MRGVWAGQLGGTVPIGEEGQLSRSWKSGASESGMEVCWVVEGVCRIGKGL